MAAAHDCFSPHICYVIANDRGATYNGYTTNFKRRLEQHNGALVGGAKATRGRGPWRPVAIVYCYHGEWTYNQALSLEWNIRYPTRRRPRPRMYNTPEKRIEGIAMAMERFPDYQFHIELFIDVPENVLAMFENTPHTVERV
jgi:predicted GIY-YIG superfamily endonuclease